jgi:hypothetical protein
VNEISDTEDRKCATLIANGHACDRSSVRRVKLYALLSETDSRDLVLLSLVQRPFLRNFSDQLNSGQVKTSLLLFFGQKLLRVLITAMRELLASLIPFLRQPRKD